MDPGAVSPGNRGALDGLFARALDLEAASRAGRGPEVLDRLELRTGMRVADMGAGGGHFTLAFARRVGPSGRVYAVDIRVGFLDRIRSRALRSGLHNVMPVLVRRGDFMLPEGEIDLAFLRNTAHHLPDPSGTFRRLGASLAPGGRLAIIEPVRGRGWLGRFGHGLHEADLARHLDSAGFAVTRRVSLFPRALFWISMKKGEIRG
jgi:ubiquinone/menaquinone biosynthesis C-methylase UbiE